MLSADLLRFWQKEGRIGPSLIKTGSKSHLQKAEQLLAIFETHLSHRRGELDEAIADLLSEQTRLKTWRGLVKVLLGRATFEIESPIDPVELRQRAFELSAQDFPVALKANPAGRKTRAELLGGLAAELGLDPAAVEDALYADHDDAQRLAEFESMQPKELLNRYNLALCQGLLCHASSMTVRLDHPRPKRVRRLFSQLKFHQLMYEARYLEPDVLELRIDGPSSLFRQSKKYGIKLASFFPFLPFFKRWRVTATVHWKKSRATLELDGDAGLETHYRERGTWVSEEEQRLRQRISAGFDDWSVEESAMLLECGAQHVLVPDFVLRHTPTERIVYVEIVGFWRRSYIERKVEQLRKAPRNLILLASRKLQAETEAIGEWPGQLLLFKGVILPKKVIEAAKRIIEEAHV